MPPLNERSSGHGLNTENGVGPPSTVGSANMNPSTIHTSPPKDSFEGAHLPPWIGPLA